VGRRTVERVLLRAATTLELVALGFDEPGDLPVCVTRIPTAIADSLTANNLRDLRLVACLL
jgi:hypothetical protein